MKCQSLKECHMQPTFEEWVQTLKLHEFDKQLLWRREKYTALKERTILPSYPGERQVEQLLNWLDYVEEQHEEGRISFREVNLQQLQERRERLFAKRDELTKDNKTPGKRTE